jgi:hypothetical protein
MGDRVHRLVPLAMALAIVVAGCARSTPDPVVDGWPIGPPADCATTPCQAWLAVAQARLAVRDPGHAEIVKATLHTEGTLVAPDGGLQVFARSGGCCAVAVFELADGTVEALGVGTPGISQTIEAIDFGP